MSKSKILIVEDEAIVAEDLKSSLEKIGYFVPAIFASGEEVLEHIEELNPDLILMDIILAGEKVLPTVRHLSGTETVILSESFLYFGMSPWKTRLQKSLQKQKNLNPLECWQAVLPMISTTF